MMSIRDLTAIDFRLNRAKVALKYFVHILYVHIIYGLNRAKVALKS